MIANSASRSVVGYRRSCSTSSAGTKKAIPTSAMRPGVHRGARLSAGSVSVRIEGSSAQVAAPAKAIT